jgi:hypothetical protein
MPCHRDEYEAEGEWPVTPVFVVGSPRSGTSMMGYFISSSPQVADFGEYTAFYFARAGARNQFAAVISPYKHEYMESLERHAARFARDKARELNCRHFVDGTPWNLRIVDYLAAEFPRAVFVLTVRHYSGVIQSLTRAYEEGRAWAGADFAARARLWSELYSHVGDLPRERTAAVSYDAFCQRPEETLNSFLKRLAAAGLTLGDFDKATFTKSHATTVSRPTVAVPSDAGVGFRPIPSYDASAWTDELQRRVEEHVFETEALLRRTFPGHYSNPANWPYGADAAQAGR